MTVKKTGKSTFFIVVAFIALFAVTAVFGIDKLYGDNRTTYVKGVDDIGSLLIDWDNGCGLNAVYGEDIVRKIDD